MIIIKTSSELESMRKAGRISAEALRLAGELVKPGITTLEINKKVHDYIISQGATPSFLDYNGFPASVCMSLNDTVIHGIPNDRVLVSGDIVSVDVGAFYDGFHGDNAATFACGEVSPEHQKLMDVTKECLELGVKQAVIGNRIGDIANAVQTHAESNGFGVVKDFVGHGVGRDMHEDPQVPNYGPAGRGVRLSEGMTIAIEPMINLGTEKVKMVGDWDVLTLDKQVSAHFEYTIAITKDGPEVLTKV